MFRRCPFVAVIADVEFDDIPVRVLVIKCRSHAVVSRPTRLDSQVLEPSVGAKQIVECFVRESDML